MVRICKPEDVNEKNADPGGAKSPVDQLNEHMKHFDTQSMSKVMSGSMEDSMSKSISESSELLTSSRKLLKKVNVEDHSFKASHDPPTSRRGA